MKASLPRLSISCVIDVVKPINSVHCIINNDKDGNDSSEGVTNLLEHGHTAATHDELGGEVASKEDHCLVEDLNIALISCLLWLDAAVEHQNEERGKPESDDLPQSPVLFVKAKDGEHKDHSSKQEEEVAVLSLVAGSVHTLEEWLVGFVCLYNLLVLLVRFVGHSFKVICN